MPYKNREDKLRYQREWYARHRERVIAKVAERKHTTYAGVCRNCGGPTVGQSPNDRPEYCSKPECASVQRRGRFFGGSGRTRSDAPEVVSLDELIEERDAARRSRQG